MAILTTDLDPFGDGSLLHLLTFDDNIDDSVGSLYTEDNRTVKDFSNGHFGKGAVGELNTTKSIEASVGSYPEATYSFRAMRKSDNNGYNIITSNASNVYIIGDYTGWIAQDHSVNVVDSSGSPLLLLKDVFYNITFTVSNNATVDWFRDGVKLDTTGAINSPHILFNNIMLYVGNGTANFDGIIDHLMVFNRVLTQSEITALSNMEEPSANPKGLNWNGNLLEAVYWNGNVTPLAQLYWNGIPVLTTPATEPLLTTAATHTGIHFPATSINKPIWASTDWTGGTPTSNGYATLGFIHNKVVETIVYPSQTIRYSWYLNQITLLFERGDDILITKTIGQLIGATTTDTLTLFTDETDCIQGIVDTAGSQGTGTITGRHMDGDVAGNNMIRIWYRSQVTDSLDPNKNTATWKTPEDIHIAYTILV